MTRKNSFIFKMVLLAMLLASVIGLCFTFSGQSFKAKAESNVVINSETYGGLFVDSRGPHLKFSFTLEEEYLKEIDLHKEIIHSISKQDYELNFYIFVYEKSDTGNDFYNSLSRNLKTSVTDYLLENGEEKNDWIFDVSVFKNTNRYDTSVGGYLSLLDNFDPYVSYCAFGVITRYNTYEEKNKTYNSYTFQHVTPIVEYKAEEDLVNLLENPSTGYDELTVKKIANNTQKLLGIYHEEDSTINLKYIQQGGVNDRCNFKNVTESVVVPSYMLQAKDKVFEKVKAIKGFNDLSAFNVVLKEYYYDEVGTSFLTRDRIARQALNYTYTYDSKNNTGTIEIVYSDFLYKDVFIRINNNDSENNLSLDVYTSNVKSNGNGTMTLAFEYESICTQIYNLCGWLPGEKIDGIFYPGIQKKNVNVAKYGEDDGVIINFNDKGIYITFAEDNQNALAGVQLDVTVLLIEDLDLLFSYRYITLNERMEETVTTSTPIIKRYSEIVSMSDKSFFEEYGTKIDKAISPECLNGQPYMTYKGIKKLYDKENGTYVFEIEYDRKNMIVVKNDKTDTCVYKVLDETTLNYTLSDFVTSAFTPKGWRIYNIFSSDEDLKIVKFSDKTPLDTQVYVNWDKSNSKIVYLTCQFTDKWVFDVEYFTQYKDTPFLEKNIINKEIRVIDYENIYQLSIEELKAILGIETFDLLKLATADSLDITFKGSGYDVKVNYTHASLKKTDYNGNIDEVKVYITPYNKWTEAFGKDWSILFLNTPGNKFFNYSNDLEKENLYGFFSVAIMEERVSDLNRIFSEYSANGCKTVYQSQEVTGSNVYKFFGNTVDGLQQVGMFLCEIFNADNKIYHSYFFYLDGTSDMSYLATNGADSYDDESSAIHNKWENFTEGVSDVWNTIDSYVYLILAIAGVILGLVLTCKLLSVIWVGSMQVTFKIITTVVLAGVWVVIGIIVVPWAVGLIGAL